MEIKNFNLKQEGLINKFEEKFKDCTVLDIEGHTISKALIKVKHTCGHIREDVNYKYVISSKLTGEFPCICNGRIKEIKSREYYQNKIDDKFGLGKITITELEKSENNKRAYVTIKFNCNHTKKWEINDLLNKTSKDYDCIICNPRSNNKITEDILVKRIKAQYKNKISYVRGFESLSNSCTFKFNKCNHEFLRSPNNLFFRNTADSLICPVCYSRDSRSYKNIQTLTDKLSNIYEPGEYSMNKRGIEAICKECNTMAGYFTTRNINGSKFRPSCECELNNQKEIVKNFMDIFNLGKTKKLNKYIDIEDVKQFQLNNRIIEFNINKSLNKELSDIDTKIDNLQFLRELKLPYNKTSINFQSPLIIPTRRFSTIELHKINAFNLNIFNIETVVEIIVRTNVRLDEKVSLYMFLLNTKNQPILSFSTNIDYSNVMKAACNVLEYITNLNNIDKNIKYSISNNSIVNNNNNTNISHDGKVEYKTLYRDTKTKYLYITDDTRQNVKMRRKIEACFDVTGHYMHIKKTGKRIFRPTYTKGEDYRYIRRIEKNYKIK